MIFLKDLTHITTHPSKPRFIFEIGLIIVLENLKSFEIRFRVFLSAENISIFNVNCIFFI